MGISVDNVCASRPLYVLRMSLVCPLYVLSMSSNSFVGMLVLPDETIAEVFPGILTCREWTADF